jgi:hypothetical protein
MALLALWLEENNDPISRAIYGVGLRPPACWDCGFESHRGYRCLFLMSVVCCHVEISTWGWSLVQRSPTVFSPLSYHQRSICTLTLIYVMNAVFSTAAHPTGRDSRQSAPPPQNIKLKKIIFVGTTFYMIYPSGKNSHGNRLVTSTLKFRKIE